MLLNVDYRITLGVFGIMFIIYCVGIGISWSIGCKKAV